MSNLIKERVLKEAKYILETNKTVREISKVFKVSKSTVHKDLQERLKEFDKNIYLKVKAILNYHINIRHLRGGEATKRKYLKMEQN